MNQASNNGGHDKEIDTSVAAETRSRAAILFYRFGPYHHARLKAAGEQLQVTGVEFSNVDSMYAWDLVEGADGFKRLTLFSGMLVEDLSAKQIRDRVWQSLDQICPQVVVIPGWSDRCSLAALWWCGTRKIPAVVMSETTAWDFERNWLKESLKRRLIKLCAAGLVGGNAHAEYLEQLGLEKRKIFLGYDTVDNNYFAAQSVAARSRTAELRKQHALPKNYFLASARFVEKKNLSRLIQAYADYRKLAIKSESRKPPTDIWNLVLLGDGPLSEAIRQQIATLNLNEYVFLHGFKQYAELPLYYGLAKVFIHASTTEQWGLVVNEAMASDLPVLVSNRCGCATDLVQEGINGFSFDPCDIKQMAGLMFRCTKSSVDLAAMGQASGKLIANWGVERFADGVKQAVAVALKTPVPQASTLDILQIKFLLRFI